MRSVFLKIPDGGKIDANKKLRLFDVATTLTIDLLGRLRVEVR